MKRNILPNLIFFGLCLFPGFSAFSQNTERQRQVLLHADEHFVPGSRANHETEIHYLSGPDADSTREWDFFCTAGRKAGVWSKIAVPSCWEMQGYGTLNYGHDSLKANEKGLYKHRFQAAPEWKKQRQVNLVFEGSFTDTEVKINGKKAGEVHQGGYGAFSYNITKLLKPGENLLEVSVSKQSTDTSINQAEREADYWIFGGIYRPVYLQVLPETHLQQVIINATPDGSVQVLAAPNSVPEQGYMECQIYNNENSARDGELFYAGFLKKELQCRLRGKLSNPRPWNPETPFQYRMRLTLRAKNGAVLHTVWQKFGFNNVELKARDGLYLNGKKQVLRGINYRPSFPATGLAASRRALLADMQLVKSLNANAVRFSHTPPPPCLLDLCDSLGLLAVVELPGRTRPYGPEAGPRLAQELVSRNENHVSVFLWSHDTESKNTAYIDEVFSRLDLQKRPLLHPGLLFSGIDALNFKPAGCCPGRMFQGSEVFLATALLHGNYGGGLGAGLADYWGQLRQNPRSAGGFLWTFADEGLGQAADPAGLNYAGGNAADGAFDAFRRPSASAQAIHDVWSPVEIGLKNNAGPFNGLLTVQNKFEHSNTGTCTLHVAALYYRLPKAGYFGKTRTADTLTLALPYCGPGGTAEIKLPPAFKYQKADALNLSVTDRYGREVYTHTLPLTSVVEQAAAVLPGKQPFKQVLAGESNTALKITVKNHVFTFSKSTATLSGVETDGILSVFGNGPLPVTPKTGAASLNWYSHNCEVVVETRPAGLSSANWRFYPSGWAKLEYSCSVPANSETAGISFSLPPDSVKSVQFLADGPSRVWQNRQTGHSLNYYGKNTPDSLSGYNTATDASEKEPWGYYSGFRRVLLQTSTGPVTVLCGTDSLYLRLFSQKCPLPAGAQNYICPAFPQADFSVMHRIPSMGDKYNPAFSSSFTTGKPQPARTCRGTLWFYFGNEE